MATLAMPSTTRLAAGLARRGLHYGWLIVAVTFITMLCGAAVRSMPGVLIRPLEAEFGWDRASIATAVSLNLLLFGAMGPFVGRWMDRYGPRRVVIGGVISSTLLTLFVLPVLYHYFGPREAVGVQSTATPP